MCGSKNVASILLKEKYGAPVEIIARDGDLNGYVSPRRMPHIRGARVGCRGHRKPSPASRAVRHTAVHQALFWSPLPAIAPEIGARPDVFGRIEAGSFSEES